MIGIAETDSGRMSFVEASFKVGPVAAQLGLPADSVRYRTMGFREVLTS